MFELSPKSHRDRERDCVRDLTLHVRGRDRGHAQSRQVQDDGGHRGACVHEDVHVRGVLHDRGGNRVLR